MNLEQFGKDAVIYAAGNIGLRTASFLLVPFYTHSLSVSDYGLLATLLVTIQIMTVFMDLGTPKGFVRFAAKYESKNLIGYLLGSSMLINIAGALVVTAISVLFLLPFFRRVLHRDQIFEYVVLTCCVAMVQSLYTDILSYYRARQEGVKFVIASFVTLVLLVAVNLEFLVILHQGVKGALRAQIITYGSLWLFASLNIFSQVSIGFSMELIWKLLRFGFPLVFVMSSNVLLDTSAMFFLSYFANLEQVAIYSLGCKIAQIAGIVLVLPFQLAYEPFVYAHMGNPEIRIIIAKLLTYLMLAFALVAFGIAFTSRSLLSVIAPPTYFSAYLVIFLVLPGIAFTGVYYIGESLLHMKDKTHITGTIVSAFTLVGMILNYLLIPDWGMYGAIFASNVTITAIAVLSMILGVRAFPIPLELGRLGAVGTLLILLLTMTFLLDETNPFIYYGLLPIAAGVSVAFICFGSFCDDREKIVIRNALWGIRAKMLS